MAQLVVISLCVLQPASGEEVNEPGSHANPAMYHNDNTHELDGARRVSLSPDGKHLYVTAHDGNALSVYDVDNNGTLSTPRIYRDNNTHELDGDTTGIVLSHDGQHLYVTAFWGSDLSVYSVASDGALSNLRIYRDDNTHELNGATNVALSPDGRHLYITAAVGNTLSVYDMDSDGARSNPRIYRNDNIHELAGARGVTLSPDGQHLYVAASLGNALSVYDVASDGALFNPRIYRNDDTHMLNGAWDVALSPDGQHLYVAAFRWDEGFLSVYNVASDGALSNPRFSRNGALTKPRVSRDGDTQELNGSKGKSALSTAIDCASIVGITFLMGVVATIMTPKSQRVTPAGNGK
ncbi:lactonase family protein [Endozoicomonas numazuensis]|uniref:SMP-30/Gluconolactonase/LRE-like region domain-containing protein n=1 Tax=Endozoicomonas numazuensis TaxID=1137799 RepID=A0A081N9J6_9GAMM|nr:beta-propeller fold lactonase family protein [Endozoicomonas numazuensis]KEQ15119.1 hypothetical protein GZ78_25025 [Endozoicomonas numazuensis]